MKYWPLTICLLLAACSTTPLEPRVSERWQVNPSNIQAFIETRNNINSILALEDSYYVAFSGIATGLKTTDVFLRRYDRAGGEWDSTRRISNGSGLNRAPVLLADGDTVLVAWMLDRVNDGGGVSIGFRRSPDRGLTWEEPVELDLGRVRTRVPQLLTDGTRLFICISNADQGQPEEVLLFSSSDGGRSWREMRFGSEGIRATEPILAAGESGHLVLSWFESGRRGRLIRVSTSPDGGESWSEPQSINDSSLLMARAHCLAVDGDDALVAWVVRNGSQGRVLIDQSTDGGSSWGADKTLFEDNVRVITPVCKNLRDNKKLVAWSLASSAVGELGMRILYYVVDAAAKAGGSGVQTERSLIGPPVVGKTYQKFDVAAVGSLSASAYATAAPNNLGVFVSVSSGLEKGFGSGVRVCGEQSPNDCLSPRIGRIENGRVTLLYNSREAARTPTQQATRLGDLFLAVLELQ